MLIGYMKVPKKGYGEIYGGDTVICRISKHPLYGKIIQVDPAETHVTEWVNNNSHKKSIDQTEKFERELELAKAIRSVLWVKGAKGWTVVPPNLDKLANWAKAQNCLAASFGGDWDKIPVTHQIGADETEGIIESPTEAGELRFLREFEWAIRNVG
jgi:hypothetical protein